MFKIISLKKKTNDSALIKAAYKSDLATVFKICKTGKVSKEGLSQALLYATGVMKLDLRAKKTFEKLATQIAIIETLVKAGANILYKRRFTAKGATGPKNLLSYIETFANEMYRQLRDLVKGGQKKTFKILFKKAIRLNRCFSNSPSKTKKRLQVNLLTIFKLFVVKNKFDEKTVKEIINQYPEISHEKFVEKWKKEHYSVGSPHSLKVPKSNPNPWSAYLSPIPSDDISSLLGSVEDLKLFNTRKDSITVPKVRKFKKEDKRTAIVTKKVLQTLSEKDFVYMVPDKKGGFVSKPFEIINEKNKSGIFYIDTITAGDLKVSKESCGNFIVLNDDRRSGKVPKFRIYEGMCFLRGVTANGVNPYTMEKLENERGKIYQIKLANGKLIIWKTDLVLKGVRGYHQLENGKFEILRWILTKWQSKSSNYALKNGYWYENDSDGAYLGNWKNGRRHGKGTYYHKNGAVTNGVWKHGKTWHCQVTVYLKNGEKYVRELFQGKEANWATYHYKNGDRYVGKLFYGKPILSGIVYFKNGDKCDGEWKDGKHEGKVIYDYKNGDKYDGYWKDGKQEGYGTCCYKNGDKYEGRWKNGKQEGYGTCSYKNGDKYKGKWKSGKRDGKGKYYYKNGDIFEGYWTDGKQLDAVILCYHYGGKPVEQDGELIFHYKNGEKYVGEWKDGKIEGKGKLYYKNGWLKYEGKWKDGKIEGKGKLYHKNGWLELKYEGNWKNGMKDGQGTLFYEGGTTKKYDGEWKNDKREGEGTLFDRFGKKYYWGHWKNDRQDGDGKQYKEDGTTINYSGTWKNGFYEGKGAIITECDYGYKCEEKHYMAWNDYYIKIEGKATIELKNGDKIVRNYVQNRFRRDSREEQVIYYYKNGEKYIGGWENIECFRRTGEGTLTYKNGSKYNGEWKANRQHGKGTYTNKNGILEYDGEWKDGKVEGEGTRFDNFGKKYYQGSWKKGKQHGQGERYKKDGTTIKYKGKWKNGCYQGEGVFFDYDGKNYYDGGNNCVEKFNYDQLDGKVTIRIENGDKIVQEFCQGRFGQGNRKGPGIYYYKNGDIFNGNLEPGVEQVLESGPKKGKGIYDYKNGGKYRGEWKVDKRHGNGIYYYKNGEKYVGNWKDGKREGKGTLFNHLGKKYYEGNWKNGKKDGMGVLYKINGTIRYKGKWKDGYFQGKGTVFKYDGATYYDGNDYIEDLCYYHFDGKVTIILENGDKYEREFHLGTGTGPVTYYYKNGDKYIGDRANQNEELRDYYTLEIWKSTVKHGKGILFNEKGETIFEGYWKNDKQIGKGASKKN